jgi:hypothetical protein
MSLCALCGQPTGGENGVCLFHLYYDKEEWAAVNRKMCDFVHRGVIPPAPTERTDLDLLLEDLVGTLDEAVAP